MMSQPEHLAVEVERDPANPTPTFAPIAARTVLLALRDVTERSLLGRYLEAQGWTVRLAEVERVVRQWHDGLRAPFVVLKLEDDDPDAFAVFGALAARTLTARVIVTITPALAEELSFAEARLLGIERLVVGAKFADLASALDELRWLR